VPTVDHARAAELQALLEGVPLPASKQQLIDYLWPQDARAAEELRALPDREYERLDDVGEALAPTEPRPVARTPVAREESGAPPGGPDYLEPHPKPGQVRHGDPPV
jgi:Protein of unknown function (DUF2795)